MTRPARPDAGPGATRLLVALDVDGTIVGPDRVTISPRVHASVRTVHAVGHHVVLATGRSPAATVPVTAGLCLAGGYAVCSNGAVTLRTDARGRAAVVADATFDPRALLAVLGPDRPDGAVAVAVAVELPGVDRGFRATAAFPREKLPGAVRVVPWSRLGAGRVRRLICYAARSTAEVARTAGELGLDCVGDTTGVPGAVEIGRRGVSKASALEALRVDLGVAPTDTVAVGDHMNDLDMLRWAARGVAMGHAPAPVRAAASQVTGSWDDDGLAVVLESVVAATTPAPAGGGRTPEPR